jgi:hypothetical protein
MDHFVPRTKHTQIELENFSLLTEENPPFIKQPEL